MDRNMSWTYCEHEDGLWLHEAYDTKEEAIQEGKKLYKSFYVAELTNKDMDLVNKVENVTGWIDTDISPNIKEELKKALLQTVHHWMNKHELKTVFYFIKNVQKVDV